jgi:hypothetical protein
MHEDQQTSAGLAGFDVPHRNWFKLPHAWTDLTAQMRSRAEQKVVEYVLRHTWGYQEYGGLKRITLGEFAHGRRRADGTRLDRGIGMRKQAIIRGIRQAVADGFLVEEVDDRDRGRTKKFYGLRMLAHVPEAIAAEPDQGYEDHTPAVRASHSSGMTATSRTERETPERHLEKPLNGLFTQLPDLGHAQVQTEYIAETILAELGDAHSRPFYRLVAAKIPGGAIRRALAEVKTDGAQQPARLFTYKMKQAALRLHKAHIGSRSG